jgi:hypothetical protein
VYHSIPLTPIVGKPATGITKVLAALEVEAERRAARS